jgi:hypothetical protein
MVFQPGQTILGQLGGEQVVLAKVQTAPGFAHVMVEFGAGEVERLRKGKVEMGIGVLYGVGFVCYSWS